MGNTDDSLLSVELPDDLTLFPRFEHPQFGPIGGIPSLDTVGFVFLDEKGHTAWVSAGRPYIDKPVDAGRPGYYLRTIGPDGRTELAKA